MKWWKGERVIYEPDAQTGLQKVAAVQLGAPTPRPKKRPRHLTKKIGGIIVDDTPLQPSDYESDAQGTEARLWNEGSQHAQHTKFAARFSEHRFSALPTEGAEAVLAESSGELRGLRVLTPLVPQPRFRAYRVRLVVRRLQRCIIDNDSTDLLREVARPFFGPRRRCPKLHRSNFLQTGLRVGLVNHALALPPLHYWKSSSPRSSEALCTRIRLRGLIRTSSRIRCPRLPRHDLLAVGIIHRRLGQVIIIIMISECRRTVHRFESVDTPGEGHGRPPPLRFLPRNVLAVVVPGRL